MACELCGAALGPRKPGQRFCGVVCRTRAGIARALVRRRARGVAPRRKGEDPEKRKQWSKRWYTRAEARGRAFLYELKNRPCMDCGRSFPPYVMQFDHARGVKVFTIGQQAKRSLVALAREVAKCDVVCANCHFIRTHERTQKKVSREKSQRFVPELLDLAQAREGQEGA